MFNSLAQLGAAFYLSLSTTIQSKSCLARSTDTHHVQLTPSSPPASFPLSPGSPIPSAHGYRNAFFFSMGLQILNAIWATLFFVDPLTLNQDQVEADAEKGTAKQR